MYIKLIEPKSSQETENKSKKYFAEPPISTRKPEEVKNNIAPNLFAIIIWVALRVLRGNKSNNFPAERRERGTWSIKKAIK